MNGTQSNLKARMARPSRHVIRSRSARKAREALAFKRSGGLFGAVCRFLFAMPGA